MKRIVSCLVFCFLCVVATAQQVDSANIRVWTLRECVEYALAHNLDVERGIYNVESSDINYDQAIGALYPTLNASFSNGFGWGRTINNVTNDFTTRQNYFVNPGAQSSVTLFNGLQLQNTIRQRSGERKASELDLQKAKNDVSLNVINLYINVIFNKELVENARLQLRSSEQQLDRAKKQVAAGALPKSDELNLDAQVATNELNLINNENALTLSLLQLKQALQIPASTALDVEIPDIGVEDLILEQNSEDIFAIARQNMPEVKSADLKIKAASYALRATRGNLFPRLSMSAGAQSNYSSVNAHIFVPDGYDVTETTEPIGFFSNNGERVAVFGYQLDPYETGRYIDGPQYPEQLKNNFARNVTVTLSIPIANGLQAKSAVRRAEVNQQLAEISFKQVNQTLRQNVESAYNDAVAASKSYNSSLRQVQAREEAYRMVKQRYDLGSANFVEYQVAENDLFRARSDLSRAKYNFVFRKKLLDFYQGKPLGL